MCRRRTSSLYRSRSRRRSPRASRARRPPWTMIVVADAGPLHYLILLDHAELLHRFYGQVVVPDAVAIELPSPSAPNPVRDWMALPPPWLRVVQVESESAIRYSCPTSLRCPLPSCSRPMLMTPGVRWFVRLSVTD